MKMTIISILAVVIIPLMVGYVFSTKDLTARDMKIFEAASRQNP